MMLVVMVMIKKMVEVVILFQVNISFVAAFLWPNNLLSNTPLIAHGSIYRGESNFNTYVYFNRALSRFEESNFEASQDHLRLIPGNSLNAMADSVRKSSWSIVPKETEVTFTPLWDLDKIYMAADLCLIQAGVLYALSGGTATKNNIKDGKVM